jgi:hypothetical protein
MVGKIVRKHIGPFINLLMLTYGIFFVLQLMDLTRFQAAEEFELERQHDYRQLRTSTCIWPGFTTAYNYLANPVCGLVDLFLFIIGGRQSRPDSMRWEFLSSLPR